MKVPRQCAWEKCPKSFLPKQRHQKYCSKSHKVRAAQERAIHKGDVKMVKVCQFRNHPLDHQRCCREEGHEPPHRVEIWPPVSLDSKLKDTAS